MGMITDENGKKIDAEPTDGKPVTNGQSHGLEVQDVRGLPTGTLIYNLIRVTGEEVGIEGFIHQMEAAKKDKKMIGDPPQLARAKEVYGVMVHRRFVFANELNQRFKEIDEARAAACGIEIFVPEGDVPPAEEAAAGGRQCRDCGAAMTKANFVRDSYPPKSIWRCPNGHAEEVTPSVEEYEAERAAGDKLDAS